MSAKMLTKRGRCCKSVCIHCPYGHTLKKEGLKFFEYSEETKFFYEYLKDLNITDYQRYKGITLKNIVVGFIKVDKLFVLDLILRDNFQDQGLTKELVESYYFY